MENGLGYGLRAESLKQQALRGILNDLVFVCVRGGGGWKMASEPQKLELQVVVGRLMSALGYTLRCSPRAAGGLCSISPAPT